MTSKMISIKKEVYENLKRLKYPDESFSEVITRLIEGFKKDPLKHFGIADDLSKEVNDEFENAIKEARLEDSKKDITKIQEDWIEDK